MARINTVQKFRGTSKTESGNLRCSKCSTDIKPGDSYKWYAKRSPGARSGYRVNVCMSCQIMPWENGTSSPHIAAMMQAEHYGNEAVFNVDVDYLDTSTMIEALEGAVQSAGEYVREAAEGYGESADNIEDGFGHETQQSEELREKAEQYEQQADELDSWSYDGEDPPEREDDEDLDEDENQEQWESAVDAWLEAAKEEASAAVDEHTEQW